MPPSAHLILAAAADPGHKIARFRLHYVTIPNQNLLIVGEGASLGNWDEAKAFKMGLAADNIWQAEVNIPADAKTVTYTYLLVDDSNGTKFWEGGARRTVTLGGAGPFEFRDTWRAANLPESTFLRTAIFEEILFQRPTSTPAGPVQTRVGKSDLTIKFCVHTLVAANHTVFLSGNSNVLGDWNLARAIPLVAVAPSHWQIEIAFNRSDAPFEYKYVVLDENKRVVTWEEGSNRRLELSGRIPFSNVAEAGSTEPVQTIVCDEVFRKPFNWRGSGIAVPVFSLRTGEGLGVGEFADIKKLVDLSVILGTRLIQLLPVNDTSCFLTWRDSYPYSGLSVFALHPQYLRLQSLTKDEAILSAIEAHSAILNALPQIDYEAMMAAKNTYIARIFAAEKSEFLQSKEFVSWKAENKHWLLPYVVFCHLRDVYKTIDYSQWKKEDQHLSFQEIERVAEQYDEEVSVKYFVQFHLHKQLLDASHYAASKGVGLKGDLPIGVNRASVDVWLNPELFHMDMSTGAPPDQFSEDGQNWGFPTYDWDRMKQDNYAWWRARLTHMAKYFHCFRIDHVLGFFRIWEIPVDFESGLMGHYNPSIPISKQELEDNGLWDIDRLTVPFVDFALLQQLFGDDAKHAAGLFFEPYLERLRIKSQFSTEHKLLKATESLPDDTDEAKRWKALVRKNLIQVVKNVVFLRSATNPNEFYPRVNNNKTISFARLPGWQQDAVWKLYLKYFYGSAQEDYWATIASSRLPVIREATDMLVCAEDLGMVPKCVEPVLSNLGILGLRIQRMPPDPQQDFGLPQSYEYLSVCTPSSHDTSTIRGWWQEDYTKTQAFYNSVLGREDIAPEHCETWIAEQIIAQHMHSPSMWAIFPIQDLFAIEHTLRVANPNDEKINEPSNPKHYWRYRMHVTIDQLINHRDWLRKVKGLIAFSGRG